MNTFSLDGKTALITGGLGGYGLAIAGLILKRGGRVLLADLKDEAAGEVVMAEKFKDSSGGLYQ
jgi:NAD(P)-dependent dehydrogenase (short-subunit alcohol dehydrogenase family)